MGSDVALGDGRRWLVPAVVVAVAAVALGIGALTAHSDEPRKASPTLPPATAPDTTEPSTTIEPTTTVVPLIVEGFTPVAGMPSGLALLGVTDDGRRFTAAPRLGEVASGPIDEAARPAIEPGMEYWLQGFALGEHAVFPFNQVLVASPDIQEPFQSLGEHPCGVFGPSGDAMWVTDCLSDQLGKWTVSRITADGGAPSSAVGLSAIASVWGVDGRGGLVLATPTGSYLLDAENSMPRLLTRNELVAIGPDVLLERVCDDTLQCRLQSVDRDTGASRTVPLAGANEPLVLLPGSMSPSGHWLVMANPVARSATDAGMIVDLTTGAVRIFEARFQSRVFDVRGVSTLTWTPDESQVLWLEPAGVVVLDVATATRVRIGEGTILDRARAIVVVDVERHAPGT